VNETAPRARRALPLLAAAAAASWLLPHEPPEAPPRPLPAELDLAFVADLPKLVGGAEDGEIVGIAWRPSASSWHWTMAAYLEPRLRFEWLRPQEIFAGQRVLVERDFSLEAPWTLESCGEGWCCWRR